MKIFGHDFVNLDIGSLDDLRSLERENAVYSDQWIDGLDDFRHVRIPFSNEEIAEYVRSMKAFDLFLGVDAQWARDVEGIPADIAARADAFHGYNSETGEKLGPPWHCAAGFMGSHLEAMVCGMDDSRRQILEEHGTAAFLTTIRRAVDALTPAVRCFANREKGLAAWPITREDDVRDLLFAMLRASISDIRREEPVPSRAGGSRVADLRSSLARTLIEIKWVREGRWRKILDEMYADIQTYGRHPDCTYLIFVIVDSARAIPDPHLVEAELSGSQTIDGKQIRVMAYVREP